MNAPRPVAELIAVADPAWPVIEQAISEASTPVQVLDVSAERGQRVLHRLQVSAASVLGALALNCGGLLVDHGWLRLLGGGHGDLPSLAGANGLGDPDRTMSAPPALVVGFDVLGGQFAIDGGGLGASPGELCYRGPDTLRWDGLGTGHAAFVLGALSGSLDSFYADLRWPGWEREVAALRPAEGLLLFPPPFMAEGRNLGAVSRRPAPLAELFGFYEEAEAQIGSLPDGTKVRIRFE